MALFRLYLIIVLLFIVSPVNSNVVTTTPVTVRSETKPLTGALFTNFTTQTTRPTSDSSSQPIISTEFKRGQYNLFVLFLLKCLINMTFTIRILGVILRPMRV